MTSIINRTTTLGAYTFLIEGCRRGQCDGGSPDQRAAENHRADQRPADSFTSSGGRTPATAGGSCNDRWIPSWVREEKNVMLVPTLSIGVIRGGLESQHDS